MITNLVHLDTNLLLSLEDAWFEDDGILFLENWWLCECGHPNQNTAHHCVNCQTKKIGIKDASLGDMWGLLGRSYEYNLDALRNSQDFVVIENDIDDLLSMAPVVDVQSTPIEDDMWDIKVWYDMDKFHLSSKWLGIHYNLRVAGGDVIDSYQGLIQNWPHNDVARALNYLLDVDYPVMKC